MRIPHHHRNPSRKIRNGRPVTFKRCGKSETNLRLYHSRRIGGHISDIPSRPSSTNCASAEANSVGINVSAAAGIES
jgi:hypothetical protein